MEINLDLNRRLRTSPDQNNTVRLHFGYASYSLRSGNANKVDIRKTRTDRCKTFYYIYLYLVPTKRKTSAIS